MTGYQKLYRSIALLSLLLLLFMAWANAVIKNTSKPYLSDSIEQLSGFRVGLLLGTRKNLQNGEPNEFFFNRIDATIELYKKMKITYILISGDNNRAGYNEPLDMKRELLQQGIPDSVIYLDYAGFRTLDSVVRAKAVFGLNRILVISQRFHNERAVYLARAHGIEAFGYNAKDVQGYKGVKTMLREAFAKTKAWIDLTVGVQPRFFGERIKIG